MSASVMLFVVIATAIFRINNINGMKVLDIGNIHRGELHKKGFSFQRTPEYQLLEKEQNDDFMGTIQGIVRSPLIELSEYRDNDVNVNRQDRDRKNKYSRYQIWPWRPYLYVKPPWLKGVYTPRKLNYIVDDTQKSDLNDHRGKYSKIYLVLDSDADLTKSDISDVNNLKRSVLSKSKARKKSAVRDHVQKEQRYKGFVLSDNRRRIRESKEMFAPVDSVERNLKQKRVRGDYGGGGGRTAIPYIRHRGDIFEKE